VLAIVVAMGIVAIAPAAANASITLNASFSTATTAPSGVAGICPTRVADECGTMQLAGLGKADWAYFFGPTFEPHGLCFDVDGTFRLTLQSDASTISGTLTGVFCPGPSPAGDAHDAHAFGNPFIEDDVVDFSEGTGQFEGLSGTALFHTLSAGARFKGTLKGTLNG